MRVAVGIDLGSTTTKAVILDEDARVLGRGITNSRSNYDLACKVALTEALIRARFGFVASGLERSGVPAPRVPSLLATLERRFRCEQYLGQLDVLEERLLAVAPLARPDASRKPLEKLEKVVSGILAAMRSEAPSLYSEGATRKSDFFRDLAGARYLHLAEESSRAGSAPFDALVGLFDKAILDVENTPWGSLSFEKQIAAATRESSVAIGVDGPALKRSVDEAIAVEVTTAASVGTGYGRARLPFPKEQIRSEILCHGLGAHAMFPKTRTVLDIGGQDTKAIQVDPVGIVTSFQMNDRCAAGCGRYLGYIADEMNLGLHELGPMAQMSTRSVRISSTCTVFAGAELRERLSLGEKREDILKGLHRAIVLRAMSLLARSGGVHDEFSFTGGVARNPAAVDALRALIAESYGKVTMNISPESIYTGALGAALFALRGAPAGQDLGAVDTHSEAVHAH